MHTLWKHALGNALLTALYVALVATFLYKAGEAHMGQHVGVMAPIAILLLFVFSATFTSMLLLGRPLLWYLDGKHHEALELLGATLGMFFLITLGVLAILFIQSP